MSYREIPLSPPSPWNADPIGAAIKTIAARTGNFNPAAPAQAGAIRVYNDAAQAVMVGSGIWQVEVSQNYLLPGDQGDYVTFIIRFQGCASISVGGFQAAPCPLYPNYETGYNLIIAGSQLFPFPSLNAQQSAGNAAIILPSMLCTADMVIAAPGGLGNYSQMLNQMYNIMVQEVGPGGTVGQLYIWADWNMTVGAPIPVTGGFQATGTGLWVAGISGWSANSGAQVKMSVGGCAAKMLGGPVPATEPVSVNYAYYYNGVGGNGGYHWSGIAQFVPNRFAL